ncbi:MAG: M1 family metallopeptidase [Fidelibacterota bacterium]
MSYKAGRYLLPVLLIFGCTGIYHRYMPNYGGVVIPKKPGKYPKITQEDLLRGELNQFKSCYDVRYYDIDVSVDIKKHSISGAVEFQTTVIQPLDTVQFDLSRKLKIDSIISDGRTVPFYRIKDAIFAIFPSQPANTDLDFTVKYGGKPQAAKNAPWDGGFVWSTDKAGNPWIGVACEGDGAMLWWPNKDHPSDEPDSVRITIHCPSEFMAVSNGRLLETREDPDGSTKAFQWIVNSPINNYNVTLYIGDYVVVPDTLQSGNGIHQINHYVLSYNQEIANSHFKQARDVLQVFEKYFGEYPWWNDGYKLVEAPYRGMEHQSAVAYGNGYLNNNNYYIYDLVDYIILHETAHKWWGNSITACDGADIWLHEAFATYSEIIYLEEKLGRLISVDYLMNKRRYIRNELPMVGPRDVNYWGFDDVYWKGAWVLHTLRNAMNDDEMFFAVIREFQSRYKKSIVCTEDFINLVNEMTGIDYTYFFHQYLYDRKPPIFQYSVDGDQFIYQWSGVQSDFHMPIYINVNEKQVWLTPTIESKTAEIPEYATIEIPDRYFYMVVEKK